MDQRLADLIEQIGMDRWAAFAADADNRLVWVSTELRELLRKADDGALGIGEHALNAMLRPAWVESMTPETGLAMLQKAAAYLLSDGLPDEVLRALPPPFAELVSAVEPVEAPALWSGTFDFVPTVGAAYPVDYIVAPARTADGELIGTFVLSYVGVRPGLLAQLGRGDADMYERMARAAAPARHAAAIVFADIESSGALSRTLPTAAYFQLIRELTAAFDATVAEESGIVGKHAGDGWTGFILAEDAGGASAAVSGSVRLARRLREQAVVTAESLAVKGKDPLRINVGIHWGAAIYLGQLVPNGRLEVTALGDEVNECARIQDCATGGSVLISKPALELLDPSDAKALGIDPAQAVYRPLSDFDTASEKTKRDAATLAVASIDTICLSASD